ncbi:MAG: hypothetical protein HGA19_07925 [Oscillochloris sp.]|nr:hypothetical protein [Oscillochloris sp.]
MSRSRFDILLLALPALLALLLWQMSGPARVHPADLIGADRLDGFSVSEPSESGTIRWTRSQARVSLPAGALPAVLVLRGAVAPGARVAVVFAGSSARALPSPDDIPQLRQYLLLVPAQPDALGWADLTLTADPPAHIGGRDLGIALTEIRLLPVTRGLRWPPVFVWLVLACLPWVLVAILRIAGAPRRLATISSTLLGLCFSSIWAAYPESVYGPLLDLRTFLGEALLWRWWLVTQIAGLIAWPLAARLVPGLPLAGYPLAKAFGLLLIAWIAWLLAMIGVMPFSLTSIGISALIVTVLAWLSPTKIVIVRSWRSWLAGVVAYEILFLGALFVGIWLRWHGAVGPALTGTEKPMEMAILNAVLRYRQFPPLDPWLAGFGLNYYYLGYVIVAALALLTSAAPAVAFNLGFALVVALTVVGVAYVAHALVALSPSTAGVRSGRLARVSVALLAVLCCFVVGSQTSALQLIVGSPLVRTLDFDQLASALIQRLGGADTIQLSHATPQSWDGPPFTTITPAAGRSFNWFLSSRALYDDVALSDGGVERRYAITEFPAFSLYLGDLHPHILAMPFDLLALAVALAFVARAIRTFSQILLAGILIGCLYCINSWDAPTYALLCVGALAIGHRRAELPWWILLIDLAGVACAALLASLPFLLTFRPPAGAAEGTFVALPVLGRLAATLGRTVNHTQLHSFLSFFGLFMLMMPLLLLAPVQMPGQSHARWLWAVSGRWLMLAIAIILGPLLGFPLLFLLPLAMLLAARAWAYANSPGQAMATWAAAVGCFILLVPELVYIRDHLEGEMSRMITIFKFYYQAWLILGIAASYAAWASLRVPGQRYLAWLWALPTTLLLAGALVYPLGLLRWAEPWQPAERTLDGFALLAREHPDDLAAARWMSTNVASNEIVLTGFCNSCDYEEASRVATISGVQTLLGWMDGHERVWRSGSPAQLAEIFARERDIPAIYAAADLFAAQSMLKHYQVRYIYLGPVERRLYGESAASFARSLPIAFSQGDVTIYRVP